MHAPEKKRHLGANAETALALPPRAAPRTMLVCSLTYRVQCHQFRLARGATRVSALGARAFRSHAAKGRGNCGVDNRRLCAFMDSLSGLFVTSAPPPVLLLASYILHKAQSKCGAARHTSLRACARLGQAARSLRVSAESRLFRALEAFQLRSELRKKRFYAETLSTRIRGGSGGSCGLRCRKSALVI